MNRIPNRHIRLSWVGFFLGLVLSLMLGLFGLPSWSQSPPTDLLQRGRDLYQAENFHQAASFLEEAVYTFHHQGLLLNQALALNYLALADYRLGQVNDASDRLHSSLQLLAHLDPTDDQQRVHAQVLTSQGQLLLANGNAQDALEHWQQAHQIYQKLDDLTGMLGTDLNQIQALRSLGRYRLAQKQVDTLRHSLIDTPNVQLRMIGWRSLGNMLHISGQLAQAQTAFETSLELAQSQNDPGAIAAAWLGIGNVERDRGWQNRAATENSGVCPLPPEQAELSEAAIAHYQSALNAYKNSAQQAPNGTTRTRALLNQLNLQMNLGHWPTNRDLVPLKTQLNHLPPGRFAVDATVNMAHNLMCLPHFQRRPATNVPPPVPWDELLQWLTTAQETAVGLGDRIAESYVLGTLGQLYEQQGDWFHAKKHTQAAIQKIQGLQARGIAYQWHWQMGRVLQQEQKHHPEHHLEQHSSSKVVATQQRARVLTSYQVALQLLQSLRQDLTALDTDVQFSFRQTIEPFYRQYADVLLQNPTPEDLLQARTVIESLQLAELDNFFQDACSTAQPELVDRIADAQDPTSAILYPIILSDRIEIIAKLPGQMELEHVSVPVASSEVRTTLVTFRAYLVVPHQIRAAQQTAQQIYQWLIQPLYDQLVQRQTQTLVFVLDTPFQSIPMGALYTGDHYLVEDFAIALTPGLQLLSPRPLALTDISALTGGLTESRLNFPPLPAVGTELDAVEAILPKRNRLLNEDFVETAIASALTESPVTVVHFATHGQFSSRAEDTFLLAYDDKIDVNELQRLLQPNDVEAGRAIELLVLSACETALGDERAALGMAGMAIRAGARSTLATLWQANDQATSDLVSEFYRQFFVEQTGNKAIALQNAQLYLLQKTRFKHPRFWAPFLLLGNWL